MQATDLTCRPDSDRARPPHRGNSPGATARHLLQSPPGSPALTSNVRKLIFSASAPLGALLPRERLSQITGYWSVRNYRYIVLVVKSKFLLSPEYIKDFKVL